MIWGLTPAIAVLGALPLLSNSVYSFTNLDEVGRRVGAVGLLDRVGVLMAAVLALRAYDLVVRGPDRGVVDLHPVRPGLYVAARLRRAALGAWPSLLAGLAALVPLRFDLQVLGLGALFVGGAWAAGLGVGIGVNLAAPALATRPGVSGLLDAVRGVNPRAQAALIWAPAVALAGAGLAVMGGGEALAVGLRGETWGYAGVLLPWIVGAAGARLAFVDGDTLARIPAVLGEVDASYAAVEAAEEGRAVYLEWIVPWAPPGLRAELLRVLRAGWRAERGWVGATFLGALVAAAAGWTDDPALAPRLVTVAGLSLAAFGLVGPRLRGHDPVWLTLSLPARGRATAVAVAIVAWGQVVVIGGVAALAVRQGVVAFASGARLEALLLLFAALGSRLPAAAYVPLALVLWALGGWA